MIKKIINYFEKRKAELKKEEEFANRVKDSFLKGEHINEIREFWFGGESIEFDINGLHYCVEKREVYHKSYTVYCSDPKTKGAFSVCVSSKYFYEIYHNSLHYKNEVESKKNQINANEKLREKIDKLP